MTGWCPYKTGTLEEQECHFDGYCSECPHNKNDLISRQAAIDVFLTELTKRERKNLLHTWSTVDVKCFVGSAFI